MSVVKLTNTSSYLFIRHSAADSYYFSVTKCVVFKSDNVKKIPHYRIIFNFRKTCFQKV